MCFDWRKLISWLKSKVMIWTREAKHVHTSLSAVALGKSNSSPTLRSIPSYTYKSMGSEQWPHEVLTGSKSLYIFTFSQSGLKSLKCSSCFSDWRHARPEVHSKIALMAKLGKSERTEGMFKAADTVSRLIFIPPVFVCTKKPVSKGKRPESAFRWMSLKSPLCAAWSDRDASGGSRAVAALVGLVNASVIKDSSISISGFHFTSQKVLGLAAASVIITFLSVCLSLTKGHHLPLLWS